VDLALYGPDFEKFGETHRDIWEELAPGTKVWQRVWLQIGGPVTRGGKEWKRPEDMEEAH
jgi:hypothetical protein